MPRKKVSKQNTPFVASTQAYDELERNVKESQAQALPDQAATFKHESSRHKRSAHNLPDFKVLPLGYSPTKKYYGLYPELFLPALHPEGDIGTVSFGSSELPPNELYLGDNLQVLRSLPTKSVDLIYIDPPFFSGRNYNLIWGDDNELRTFGDIWEDGLPSYLEWLNARLWEMARVLKDTGSIYVHCDWHASHYIKTEMDKIFGYENFQNEIVYFYSNKYTGNKSVGCVKQHDVLFHYSKTASLTWNKIWMPSKNAGRKINDSVRARVGGVSTKIAPRDEFGNVKYHSIGDEKLCGDVWDINYIPPKDPERIGYPTQKPEALLERIIKASSNAGDVVADFFMGGGTTCAVAQKLGRRFIGADVSNVAFYVTQGRLIRDGEVLSGIEANVGGSDEMKAKLQLKRAATVPDIHLKYAGIYPAQLFEHVDQDIFRLHILTILRARPSGTDDAISGYAGPNEPIFIGNVDIKNPVAPEDLKRFVESVNMKYKANTPVRARVFAWHFPAAVEKYAQEIRSFIANMARPAELSIELIPIDSPSFRSHVLTLYADVQDTALLLAFVHPPVISDIEATKVSGRKWRFEARGVRAINPGIRLVNCQWDFDYQSGHFNAQRGAILMREKDKDTFRAVLAVEHDFERSGTFTVACKIQDSAGGECIETTTITV